MFKEPPARHHTAAAIKLLATRLGYRNDPGMQDWEFEVAEPADLNKYLQLYVESAGDDDILFTLADMIIQAFECAEEDLSQDARWRTFLNTLSDNWEIHAWQVWYWACFDTDLEDAWEVAPHMRALFEAKI